MTIKKSNKLLEIENDTPSCCSVVRGKKLLVLVVLSVLAIVIVLYVGLGLTTGKWLGFGPSKNSQEYQQKVYLKEVESLTKKINQHLLLPSGELPQLRTIEDSKAAAAAQTFFAGTQDGDKVLIYVNARKAVVYSPSRDLVINVGPIFMDEESVADSHGSELATSTSKK